MAGCVSELGSNPNDSGLDPMDDVEPDAISGEGEAEAEGEDLGINPDAGMDMFVPDAGVDMSVPDAGGDAGDDADVPVVTDADEDGYDECLPPDVELGLLCDCDDTNRSINPLAADTVGDDTDNNCDGSDGVDEDRDGYASSSSGGVDCDDTNELINPGSDEIPYDGADNDCADGDDVDVDGDGFVAVEAGGDDCEDELFAINPDAPEICDGLDNNCVSGVDEGLPPIPADNTDGPCFENTQICLGGLYVDNPLNYTPSDEICDDVDNDCSNGVDDGVDPIPADNIEGACSGNNQICVGGLYVVNPGNYTPADETCDGIDNNCNGATDEGVLTTFYADSDGDAYGNLSSTIAACEEPAGFVANNTDCDDTRSRIYPGARERFDGRDGNCDGTREFPLGDAIAFVGEQEGNRSGSDAITLADVDGDGYHDVVIGDRLWSSDPENVFTDGTAGEGRTYIFFGGEGVFSAGATMPLSSADVIITGGHYGMHVGGNVKGGDYDSDGRDEVTVGAGGYNNYTAFGLFGQGTGTNRGALMTFRGRDRSDWDAGYSFYDFDETDPAVLSALQLRIVEGNDDYGMGNPFHVVGDIDGTGTKKFVVNEEETSRCDIFSARAEPGIQRLGNIGEEGTIRDTEVTYQIRDRDLGSVICENVASGNLNGIEAGGVQYADVALGNDMDIAGGSRGKVWVVFGSGSLPVWPSIIELQDPTLASSINYRTFSGNDIGYGAGLVSIADVDGDGFDDLSIGVDRDSSEYTVGGAIYTAFGDDISVLPNGGDTILNGAVFAMGGTAVYGDRALAELPSLGLTTHSDTDGDGLKDLVSGTANYSEGSEGRAFLNCGSSLVANAGESISAGDAEHFVPTTTPTSFGLTATGGGDVDGDGSQDVLITDPRASDDKGVTYLFLGGI